MEPHDDRNGKGALYSRLYVSAQDFEFAKRYAQHLLKKGWHFAPHKLRASTYVQQSAFTTALVVSYARPFTPSRGRPTFPKTLAKYSAEADQLHKHILSLRNQVYAHSDSSRYSIHPIRIGASVIADSVGAPSLRLTKDECELAIKMIDSIGEVLRPRLVELKKELVGEGET